MMTNTDDFDSSGAFPENTREAFLLYLQANSKQAARVSA
jgi:hypothetical protein